MHPWTNESTQHSRSISTGPTPDGTIDDLVITIGYLEQDGMHLHKGINVDHHIVPLILRLPEMRAALEACLGHVKNAYDAAADDGYLENYAIELKALIAHIEGLIAPTEEEAEHARPA